MGSAVTQGVASEHRRGRPAKLQSVRDLSLLLATTDAEAHAALGDGVERIWPTGQPQAGTYEDSLAAEVWCRRPSFRVRTHSIGFDRRGTHVGVAGQVEQ